MARATLTFVGEFIDTEVKYRLTHTMSTTWIWNARVTFWKKELAINLFNHSTSRSFIDSVSDCELAMWKCFEIWRQTTSLDSYDIDSTRKSGNERF